MSHRSKELRADCAALQNGCAVLKAHQQILMEQFAIQRERYYREKQEFALRACLMNGNVPFAPTRDVS